MLRYIFSKDFDNTWGIFEWESIVSNFSFFHVRADFLIKRLSRGMEYFPLFLRELDFRFFYFQMESWHFFAGGFDIRGGPFWTGKICRICKKICDGYFFPRGI